MPSLVETWEEAGQPKVTLKVENEQDMLDLVKKAQAAGIPSASIKDAGRTQLAPGTRTVAAIGPGSFFPRTS